MPKEIELFGKAFISRGALMDATGCSPHIMRQLEQKEGLTPVKFGRQIYYEMAKAKAWVKRKAA